jgi:hypothetical protein
MLAQLLMAAATSTKHFKVDILPHLKAEDSYGLPLVLQDDFGGFLPRRVYFTRRIRTGSKGVPRLGAKDITKNGLVFPL